MNETLRPSEWLIKNGQKLRDWSQQTHREVKVKDILDDTSEYTEDVPHSRHIAPVISAALIWIGEHLP